MLLDDGAVAQQFALLHRAADALKQASLQQPRAPATASPYPHLESSTSSASRASVLTHSTSAGLAGGASTAASPPSGAFAFPHNRGAAAPLSELDVRCVHNPVQLSVGASEGDVRLLREIGLLLDGVAAQLQETVEARLVDFYTHLAKKAGTTGLVAGLRAAHPPAVAVTHGAVTQSPPPPRRFGEAKAKPLPFLHATASMSLMAPTITKASVAGVSALDVSNVIESAPPQPPQRQRAAFILGPEDNLPSPIASVVLSIAGDNDIGILDHSHLEDTAAGTGSMRSLVHQPRSTLGSRRVSGYAALHNAPMARKMEEERAAAAELQSFFYLLLEAALQQTDATAAAIYLDDATLHTAGSGADAGIARSSLANAGRAPTRSPSVASYAGGGGGAAAAAAAAGAGAGAGGGAGGGGGPAARAHFLHCVAHVHGHFPHTVSCALTNVLTTVAQTGIAVNLNYSDASTVLRSGGRGGGDATSARATATARATAAASPPSNSSLYLDMYNGVVVPVKGVGCLVLANKAKRAAAVTGGLPPRFSVCDEHVAWSSALISEAVLQLYDRELLIRATGWAPPCAAVLRPFLHAKEVAPTPPSSGPSGGDGSLDRTRSNAGLDGRRGESRLGSRRRLPVNKTVKILPDPNSPDGGVQREEATSLVFNARSDIFAKRLTIVRTEDRQIGKALPPELRTSSSSPSAASGPAAQKVVAAVARSGGGSGASTFISTSGQLNDEELFLAAAQYIHNLESLWRKTISDSNMMHTMVDNYNKEIQLRGEKIVHLESRVRELNAHVVQLERRTNTTRFLA